ncbi:MAG: Hsp70 family protein, partial [Flavobacteriales bacterium]
ILHVGAKDKTTGKEQSIRIEASSGLSKDDIEKMKREATANADTDRQAREKADKLNQADSLIFQVEKQMKEFGDKLPADKKGPIETALAELRKAHGAQDMAGIDTAMSQLNNVFQTASQEMYAAAQQAQQPGASANEQNTSTTDQEVTDVDFEEVKDGKK